MDIKTILHPTDGSDSARKALDFACELAAERKAQLLIVHVQRRHGSERIPPELEQFSDIEHVRATEARLLRSAAEFIVEDARIAARDRGITAVDARLIEGDPAERIVELARADKVDAIVMGSRGLGDLEGLLLGSVSHKVAHAAPCSCLIVR
jgi:nucleotide-binding universal stress UspA family protein